METSVMCSKIPTKVRNSNYVKLGKWLWLHASLMLNYELMNMFFREIMPIFHVTHDNAVV